MKNLLLVLLLLVSSLVSSPVFAADYSLLPLFTIQPTQKVEKNHFSFVSFDRNFESALLKCVVVNGYQNSVGAYPSIDYVNLLVPDKGWTDIIIPHNVDPNSFKGMKVHQLSKEQTEIVWKSLAALKPMLKPHPRFFFAMPNPKNNMRVFIHHQGGFYFQVPKGFIKFGYLTD